MMFLIGTSYILADNNNKQDYEEYSKVCDILYHKIQQDIMFYILYAEQDITRIEYYKKCSEDINKLYYESSENYNTIKYVLAHIDCIIPTYSYDILPETDEYQEYINWEYTQYLNGSIKTLKYIP